MSALPRVLLLGCLAGCGNGAVDAVGVVPGGLSLDLVAHWAFDDGTGSEVRDSSVNHHDGVLDGSTWSWPSDGRFGGALHLEKGDFVTVDDFPAASEGWTVAAWVRIASKDAAQGEVTVVTTEDVFKGGWEMSLIAETDDIQAHFGYYQGPGTYDYAYYSCDKCIGPDRWQHIAAVVDGSAKTLAFYLDGVLRARVANLYQAISPGLSTLYLGRWQLSERLLAGSLDDIAIWSRALASAEIVELTKGPVPGGP